MSRLYPMYGGRVGTVLLLLRLIVGTAFLFHGWPKVQDVAGFAAMLRVPVWLAGVAAYTEVVGGAMLILGLLTPLAALFLAVQMAVAIVAFHVPAGDPFVSSSGPSYEVAAVYLVVTASLLIVGPGAYSLDAGLFGERPRREAAVPRRRGEV